MSEYNVKYLKYKNKYLNLKKNYNMNMKGGVYNRHIIRNADGNISSISFRFTDDDNPSRKGLITFNSANPSGLFMQIVPLEVNYERLNENQKRQYIINAYNMIIGDNEIMGQLTFNLVPLF